MKREGEITGIKNHIATVRIYKDEEPTSLTVNASFKGDYAVADYILVEMHPVLFFLYTTFAYILPFITASIAYAVSSFFTDSVITNQVVLLLTLLVTYLLSLYFEKTTFFEKLTVCKITGKIEE